MKNSVYPQITYVFCMVYCNLFAIDGYAAPPLKKWGMGVKKNPCLYVRFTDFYAKLF
jgi:hypothetical protein